MLDKPKRKGRKSKTPPTFNFSLFKEPLKNLFVAHRNTYKKEELVFLCCDPGISNFAFVVFKILNLPLTEEQRDLDSITSVIYESLEVIDYGFIANPLIELKQENIIPRIQSFLSTNSYLKQYSPDYLVMERFQARGIKGPAGEIINYHIAFMLSLFSEESPLQPLKAGRLLIPATWKSYYRISKDESFLENKYAELKTQDKLYKKKVKIHHIDSLFLGLYLYLEQQDLIKYGAEFKQSLFKFNFFEKFKII